MTTKDPKRTRSEDEAAWIALTHGELSSEEAGVLRALAEGDPSLKDHVAAHEPLAPEFVAGLIHTLDGSLAQHRRRRRGLWWGSAASAVAAAAVVMMVNLGGPSERALDYSLHLTGGIARERGSDDSIGSDEVPRFEAETELEIVAMPSSRSQGKVELRAYLLHGAHVQPLPISFRRRPGGGLFWRGSAAQLIDKGPGRYRVALIVIETLPSEAETRTWVEKGDPRVLFGELDYVGPEARLDASDEQRFAQIEEAKDEGHLDEAERALEALLGSSVPQVRVRALSLRPRLSAARGHLDRALDEFVVASREARRSGFEQQALDNLLVRADWLRRKGFRLTEAERALDEIARDFARHPGAAPLVAYQRAMCASDAGDVRSALSNLKAARRGAGQAPYGHELARATIEVEAVLLNAIGRTREARALLGEAEALVGDDACERAGHLTNVGWLSLMASERGEGAIDYASLTRAYELFTEHGCDASYARNAAINLALAGVLAGDERGAERWLGVASRHGESDEPPLVSWSLDVAGRVALRRGDAASALRNYRELDARTNVAGEPADRFRAATGMARALLAAGDPDGARDAYLRAESILDEETAGIPFYAGRETFSGVRDASARELADLELRRGRDDEAYRVLRRARARALRGLALRDLSERVDPAARERVTAALEAHYRARAQVEAAQDDAFAAPLDELPELERKVRTAREEARAALDRAVAALGPVRPNAEPVAVPDGELVLALFPLHGGWTAFAETSRGTRHADLQLPADLDDGQLLERALAPFARELERARRVRLLPYGPLRSLDWHALPYGGVPLIERAPVVYGADLAADEASRAGNRVLIVSDPRGNLGRARDEGREVAAKLRARGAKVVLLEGRAATRAAVQEALESADLLHVAAHAEGPGRRERLGAILLADDAQLDVGDILALPHAPRRVVLSTCEGALEPGESKVPGLGLAQAFLARGSEQVVASTRRVPDDFAKAFALALYDGSEDDLATSLQTAVRSLRASEPANEHWKSYRTWVR